MAKVIGNVGQRSPGSGTTDPGAIAGELDVLAGQQQGQLGGKTITVREYGFFEAARILQTAAPLVTDLQPLFEGADPPSMLQVMDALMSHPDLIRHLLACSIAAPPADAKDHAAEVREQEAWLETLNETDGEHMLLLWWQANSSFSPPPAPKRRQSKGTPVGYGRVFTDLINAGYGRSFGDIGRMTKRQISLAWEHVQAQQRRARRERITDANAAYAGGNSMTTLLKDLK